MRILPLLFLFILIISVVVNTEVVRYTSQKQSYVKGLYFGQSKNGMKTGSGIYIYVDGSVYIGEFKNNKLHGKGTFYSSSGGNYSGSYKHSKMDGNGTYTYPGLNGKKIVGEWTDDNLVKEYQPL